MVSSTLFAPLLAIYRKRYPGIDIRLFSHRSNESLTELAQMYDPCIRAMGVAGPDADFPKMRAFSSVRVFER